MRSPSTSLSRRNLLSAAASAALLQACGGGGSSAPGSADPVSSGPPRIAAEPADASVMRGTAATFRVSASGADPLTYQWLRDGAPIAGATDAAYTIASPTMADDGGRFAVVVGNAVGSVTSRTATLSVVAVAGIELLAGGLGGRGLLDGAGAAARFYAPFGLAVAAGGDIYVSDYPVLRKIAPDGTVSTFAGKVGEPTTVDGPLASARFVQPAGLCSDAAGNLFVVDYGAHAIRKISASGTVTTVAGQAGVFGSTDGAGAGAQFFLPWGIVRDSAGNLFVGDSGNHTIRKITPAGVVSTFAGTVGARGYVDATGAAARLDTPSGLAIDPSDNLYVADTGNNLVRKITPAGVVTTVAGSAGASFDGPRGLAWVAGVLYVADRANYRLCAIAADGTVSTVVGGVLGHADGVGAAARMDEPFAVAADAGGNLYVADFGNFAIRKVNPATRTMNTLAGSPVHEGSSDGTGAAARFWRPMGVAMDAAGNAYVADAINHVIRKITPQGVTTTIAGTAGAAGDTDDAGAAARFNQPSGIAIDAAGTLYVADTANHKIRKIAASGSVTTLAGNGTPGAVDGPGTAARFTAPVRLTVDAGGVVYVAETFTHTVRKVTPAGEVTTFAGSLHAAGSVDGVGTAARFNAPWGIEVDAAGVLFVTDTGNQTIRRVAPDGTVTTFAGTVGTAGFADGKAAAAQFKNPCDITLDARGFAYVADTENRAIRKLDLGTAEVTTLFGHPDSIGVKTGPAPGAFNSPRGIAANPDGSLLYVVDTDENAVLAVTTG